MNTYKNNSCSPGIYTCVEQPSKDLSKPYCVYITFYRGTKLPPFYLGSGKTKEVLAGFYHGSVRSKEYESTWKQELKDNQHLFESKVLCTFTNRKQATYKEGKLQKQLRVNKHSMYTNKSFATINGFGGIQMFGSDNPAFGKPAHNKGKKAPNPRTEKWRNHISETLTGKVCWNNGTKTVRSVERPNGENWVRGKLVTWKRKPWSKELKEQASRRHMGYRWWTNGIKNTRSRICPDGYWAGVTQLK